MAVTPLLLHYPKGVLSEDGFEVQVPWIWEPVEVLFHPQEDPKLMIILILLSWTIKINIQEADTQA